MVNRRMIVMMINDHININNENSPSESGLINSRMIMTNDKYQLNVHNETIGNMMALKTDHTIR